MILRTATLLLFGLLWPASPPPQTTGQQAYKNYSDALPQFWKRIYPEGGETLYCGKRFGRWHGRNINIEHVLPMAWVMREAGCRNRKQCRNNSGWFNQIEADMHNLYPAMAKFNKLRSSFPFGEISGEKREFGNCDFEFHSRKRIVEPRIASRGNIARAMFYIHDTYGIKLFRKQGNMLKRWHRIDPPDAAEKLRNERIAQQQGTRNRFIDHPDAVDDLDF